MNFSRWFVLFICVFEHSAHARLHPTIHTKSLIPEQTSGIRPHHLGALFQLDKKRRREFTLYAGERIFFLTYDGKNQGASAQLGLSGGIYLGLSMEDFFQHRSVDTADGHFGLTWETIWRSFGLALEYTHHSAHYSDGQFWYEQPLWLSMDFMSIILTWIVEQHHAMAWVVHAYLNDKPRMRVWAMEWRYKLSIAHVLWLESTLQLSRVRPRLNFARIKLSLCLGNEIHGQFVPYVLIHYGNHFLLQRFHHRIVQVYVGVEFHI